MDERGVGLKHGWRQLAALLVVQFIQIVGRSYSDRDVFQAGMAYEAALGGWYGSAATRPKI